MGGICRLVKERRCRRDEDIRVGYMVLAGTQMATVKVRGTIHDRSLGWISERTAHSRVRKGVTICHSFWYSPFSTDVRRGAGTPRQQYASTSASYKHVGRGDTTRYRAERTLHVKSEEPADSIFNKPLQRTRQMSGHGSKRIYGPFHLADGLAQNSLKDRMHDRQWTGLRKVISASLDPDSRQDER